MPKERRARSEASNTSAGIAGASGAVIGGGAPVGIRHGNKIIRAARAQGQQISRGTAGIGRTAAGIGGSLGFARTPMGVTTGVAGAAGGVYGAKMNRDYNKKHGLQPRQKVKKDFGVSAFGVEHGEVSKLDEAWKKKSDMSTGRAITGAVFPGVHGGVAGRKGKKLKAAGHELGPAFAGNVVVPGVGGYVGAGAGTNAAQNKGYYKKEPKSKQGTFFNPPNKKKKAKEVSKAFAPGAKKLAGQVSELKAHQAHQYGSAARKANPSIDVTHNAAVAGFPKLSRKQRKNTLQNFRLAHGTRRPTAADNDPFR